MLKALRRFASSHITNSGNSQDIAVTTYGFEQHIMAPIKGLWKYWMLKALRRFGCFEKEFTTYHGAISGLMMMFDATSIMILGAKDNVNVHTNLRSSSPNTRFVQKTIGKPSAF